MTNETSCTHFQPYWIKSYACFREKKQRKIHSVIQASLHLLPSSIHTRMFSQKTQENAKIKWRVKWRSSNLACVCWNLIFEISKRSKQCVASFLLLLLLLLSFLFFFFFCVNNLFLPLVLVHLDLIVPCSPNSLWSLFCYWFEGRIPSLSLDSCRRLQDMKLQAPYLELEPSQATRLLSSTRNYLVTISSSILSF